MTTLVAKTLEGSGQVIIENSPLGKGGEGSVYSLISHTVPNLAPASELVAKIYHTPEEGDRRDKIKTMVINTPKTTSVAWPLGVLYEGTRFVGYIMTKLESSSYRQWAELSNTKDRRRTSPEFDVKYALVACRNLAAAIDSIHKAGHMVGDVNESNIFVKSDASVLIVDTDSAQIKAKDGKIFPCLVGKPEYTAPEISHGSLKDNPRTIKTDTFAFAVAVYQMMTGGAHPTDGIYTGVGDPPPVIEKIRQGIYPGLDPHIKKFDLAPRIPSECIPTRLSKYLLDALSPQQTARPPLYELVQTVDDILGSLQHCKNVKTHWYDTRDGGCLWCARGERPDPWGPVKSKAPTAPSQTTLPSVSFSDGNNAAPVVRRVAPQVSGSNSGSQNYAQTPQNTIVAPITPPPYSSHSGNVSAPQNAPQNYQTHTPEPPSIPNKIKGKTVLKFADGSYGVRPPIGQLLRHNPKMAISCIKNETPSFAHAWWSFKRPVTHLWALLVGLVLSLAIAVSWQWVLPMSIPFLEEKFPNIPIIPLTAVLIGQAAVVTSIIAVLCLFFSALKDMAKSRKQNKNLNVFERDKPIITILRFIPIPIVYGPLLILVFIVLFILAVFSILLNILTSGAGSRSRY